jgi:hypothetical protein
MHGSLDKLATPSMKSALQEIVRLTESTLHIDRCPGNQDNEHPSVARLRQLHGVAKRALTDLNKGNSDA